MVFVYKTGLFEENKIWQINYSKAKNEKQQKQDRDWIIKMSKNNTDNTGELGCKNYSQFFLAVFQQFLSFFYDVQNRLVKPHKYPQEGGPKSRDDQWMDIGPNHQPY